MSKKNIIVFTNTLLSGGAEKQALLLAANLNSVHHITLVVYYGEQVEEKNKQIIDRNQIRVVYLEGNHVKKAVTFYNLLKNNKAEIIFSYLLTTNFIGAIIGGIAGVPCRIGGIRNAFLDKRKLPVQRFINNYLSTHTVFNNYRGLEVLKQKGFKAEKAVVIPNCFELNTACFQRDTGKTVKIITVGRFVYQKGYSEALKAMQILKEKALDFKYFIIGYGPLENDIRREINFLGLSQYVEVIINPVNINDYYIRSDIYLCSSYFEGLSNTVMEALSFSLPVVATDVGDNNRLIEDGKSGFLVPKTKAELIALPLSKLISSKELRNKMGLHSYQIIKNNYSTQAFNDRYKQFIETYALPAFPS